jgi:hypothetical protein
MSDYQKQLMPGIISYSTPSHGGIHVDDELNQKIHEAWRADGGWYEEDCCWAIVAFHFPKAFTPEHHAMAINTLKNWQPHEYMKVTGNILDPSESSTLREENWKKLHETHLQVISAEGSWPGHNTVPKGMVKVTMCLGGRLNTGQYASREFRYFLVPEADYKLPFAIEDEKKYAEVKQ